MSHDKKFNNESQDARRRDKHNEVHPFDKKPKTNEKPGQSANKHPHHKK